MKFQRQGRQIWKRLGQVSMEHARRMEAALLAGFAEAQPMEGSLTVAEVVAMGIRRTEAEARTPRYQSDNRIYLQRFAEFVGAAVRVDAIPQSLLKAFRVELLEYGLSKASVNRHMAAVKAAWNFVGLDLRVFRGLKNYREPARTRTLNPEELRRLLAAAAEVSPTLKEIILVAVATGLRKANVVQLKRSEVDFLNRRITVVQKGGTPLVVHLNELAAGVLAAIQPTDSDQFWPGREGRPSASFWRKAWQKALKAADLHDVTFHTLRHTFASFLYEITLDQKVVQSLLGHSSPGMTNRYTHLRPSATVAGSEKLAQAVTQMVTTANLSNDIKHDI